MAQFELNNKAAEKWTEDEVFALLEQMYLNANSDNEILCFSDACNSVGYRDSHIDYFIKKFPVFEAHKKDIQCRIVSRVNKGALTNKMNATAAIWRSKQLGEKDKSEQETKNIHEFKGDPFKQIRSNTGIDDTNAEADKGT